MANMSSFGIDATAEEVSNALKDTISGKTGLCIDIQSEASNILTTIIVLITGCSPNGLGAEAARTIALQNPALIILAGRSISKCLETAKTIELQSPDVKTRLLEIDLSSQDSVRKAAVEVNSYFEIIDVLINNAAVMALPHFTTTVDGLENQFGTNHIGHFLFTNLIIPKILASGKGARIVNISSLGYLHGPVSFDDYNFKVSIDTFHVLRANSTNC